MTKKKGKVSIKDIAKELGISITTVSFIINGKAKNRISDSVIKRVEDYIKEVGYQPHSTAQSLRTGKSNTIVFMAEDISDPFFSKIAKRMESLAFKNGYKIIYCSTENNKKRANELLDFFGSKGIDAYIITPPENFEKESKALVESKKVVMFFDRFYKSFQHNYIVLDNYEITAKAVRKVIEKGYRKIGFVGLDSALSSMVDRELGYLESVIEPHILKLKFDQVNSAKSYIALEDFLVTRRKIDCVIFSTNSLAIAGLRVLKKNDTKIPQELAVITFDDRELFELYSPTISIISQPLEDLAMNLISETIALLNNEENNGSVIQKVLKGNFVSREST